MRQQTLTPDAMRQILIFTAAIVFTHGAAAQTTPCPRAQQRHEYRCTVAGRGGISGFTMPLTFAWRSDIMAQTHCAIAANGRPYVVEYHGVTCLLPQRGRVHPVT